MSLSVHINQSSLNKLEFALCAFLRIFGHSRCINDEQLLFCPFDIIKLIIKMLYDLSPIKVYKSQRGFVIQKYYTSLTYDITECCKFNDFKPTNFPQLYEYSTTRGLPALYGFNDQNSLLSLKDGIVSIKSYFLDDTTDVNNNEQFEMALQNIAQIACARKYVFALTNNGKLYFSNISQIENDGFDVPSLIPLRENVISIASSSCCFVILTESGLVYNLEFNNVEPILIKVDAIITSIYCNNYMIFMITNEGGLYIQGTDVYGLFGHKGEYYDTPKEVQLPCKVIKIATNLTNVFLLTANGNVYVWGGNEYGQTGESLLNIDTGKFREVFSEIKGIVNIESTFCKTLLISKKGNVFIFGTTPGEARSENDNNLKELVLS